jgi:hypothetical protein
LRGAILEHIHSTNLARAFFAIEHWAKNLKVCKCLNADFFQAIKLFCDMLLEHAHKFEKGAGKSLQRFNADFVQAINSISGYALSTKVLT